MALETITLETIYNELQTIKKFVEPQKPEFTAGTLINPGTNIPKEIEGAILFTSDMIAHTGAKVMGKSITPETIAGIIRQYLGAFFLPQEQTNLPEKPSMYFGDEGGQGGAEVHTYNTGDELQPSKPIEKITKKDIESQYSPNINDQNSNIFAFLINAHNDLVEAVNTLLSKDK